MRRWHEAACEALRERAAVTLSYLGLTLDVPAGVFAPTPVSDLLGRAVLDEVHAEDRVLDMGTGCGVNAVLAASQSSNVLGVDINPTAISAARANAVRNRVEKRTTFYVSDGFAAVAGTFDLIIIDPPFRWFAPQDMTERSIADENYEFLRRFIAEAPVHLSPGGRILLSFGTSGDIDYLTALIDAHKLRKMTIASRSVAADGVTTTYSTFRLERAGSSM